MNNAPTQPTPRRFYLHTEDIRSASCSYPDRNCPDGLERTVLVTAADLDAAMGTITLLRRSEAFAEEALDAAQEELETHKDAVASFANECAGLQNKLKDTEARERRLREALKAIDRQPCSGGREDYCGCCQFAMKTARAALRKGEAG